MAGYILRQSPNPLEPSANRTRQGVVTSLIHYTDHAMLYRQYTKTVMICLSSGWQKCRVTEIHNYKNTVAYRNEGYCFQIKCDIGWTLKTTSCARGDTICPAPLLPRGRPSASRAAEQTQRSSSFQRPIRSHGHRYTSSRVKAAVSKAACDLDLWLFDLESGVRVTCDVGDLYANFSLPRPLCSRVRPDVRDRQTSDRQTPDKNIV